MGIKINKIRFQKWVALFLLTFGLIFFLFPRPQSHSLSVSNYAISTRASFNQPSYYPVPQTLNPTIYKPIAPWVGRLILPSVEQLQAPDAQSIGSDWVWLEVYHAPPSSENLVGSIVRLSWEQNPQLEFYRQLVTTNVQFSQQAIKSQQEGLVLPSRLNGRSLVGPLQSLAGARPNDDVIVGFDGVQVTQKPQASAVLLLEQVPIEVTGQYYGLVKIEGTDAQLKNIPSSCPGNSLCPNEFFRVRHYNPNSGQFDGAAETIRIPQQPVLKEGRFASTPRELEKSPVGQAGWYIYGAKDQKGIFTVQALKPRALFQLKPEQIILGRQNGLSYLSNSQWKDTPQLKGTGQSILISPNATNSQEALQQWKEGDYGLVIHLFGGIGGKKGESFVMDTVTGHFAYGIARVIRDPFTNELQFDITYEQVYAHNTEGIIAGEQTWTTFMGNLERGWLNTRPVSDIILKLEAITTEYNFDGIRLLPLQELVRQLQIMAARYRTGDGTGYAAVTPATSCVQDSNQALYIAIEKIKKTVSSTQIKDWLPKNPDSETSQKFKQLTGLGKALEVVLTPQGVVRTDWKDNAQFLSGIQKNQYFVSDQSLLSILLSWRSMLPKRSHEEISRIFLEQNAQLWVIRTNQNGGWNPDIFPVAPTLLFGNIPIISTVLRRILVAAVTIPRPQDWLIGLGILLLYAAIALPLGFSKGFLQWSPFQGSKSSLLLKIAITFVSPAVIEEILFRVVFLPHFVENFSIWQWLAWGLISLFLFVIYHPLNAKTFYKQGYPTFFEPTFLILTGILGLFCTIAYGLTGSLWIIVIIHWIVVITWLFLLGGEGKLVPSADPLTTSLIVEK
ncbi:CPBP family glutamic-type intramembrane protease [Gloeothece verrucosa]|uniref:Abortive infection protein n=1 Tax=Gloeothece verrucosa (strain PCC 7822) TaxID=497965 RepID=E0UK23_GLOV7|nr:CPBP family glutamic-type intramembrane protease [Gloeothece verrucosa]ADN14659.1 Abortive infection protein [Gloeothece verrucosa PCC 7822]